MPTIADLCTDLVAEHASLDAVVAGLPAEGWATATPAGWDVRDSVSHLCFFDEQATLAITDPAAFEVSKAALIERTAQTGTAPEADTPDVALGREIGDPGALLARWRSGRQALLAAVTAAGSAPEPQRVLWYGPAMSLASFTTARIMETWAHGADVRDALGLPLEFSPRLRHVCHLGVSARPFAFAVHGVTDPGDPVRVEAGLPDGPPWTWGPAGAPDRITGSALDLALVFTQRRHPRRTDVKAVGPTAEQWLALAQAFAGPPTVTRPDR